MRPDRLAANAVAGAALALCFLLPADPARAQTPDNAAGACKVNTPQGLKPEAANAQGQTTAIRIAVTGADGKPVQRKRFYLLERSAKEASAGLGPAPRREDFLQGASPQLREWLARHDCDTLYCPEYEAGYASAVKTVPEFVKAYAEGLRKYKSERLALEWVTVNFPLKNVRTEFYRRRKAWLEEAARRAGRVASVMTDEKGVAFFTGVRPGAYSVSNLAPLEGGLLWDCAVTALPPIPKQLHSVTLEMGAAK